MSFGITEADLFATAEALGEQHLEEIPVGRMATEMALLWEPKTYCDSEKHHVYRCVSFEHWSACHLCLPPYIGRVWIEQQGAQSTTW